MTTKEITEKLTSIICDQLGVKPDRITPDTTFESLGADSLDAVELMIAAEDEFAINIDDEKAEAVKTVGQAIAFIEAIRGAEVELPKFTQASFSKPGSGNCPHCNNPLWPGKPCQNPDCN